MFLERFWGSPWKKVSFSLNAYPHTLILIDPQLELLIIFNECSYLWDWHNSLTKLDKQKAEISEKSKIAEKSICTTLYTFI